VWIRVVESGLGPKQNPPEGSLGRENLTVSVGLTALHLQVEGQLTNSRWFFKDQTHQRTAPCCGLNELFCVQ
jgi:hypothetical protein